MPTPSKKAIEHRRRIREAPVLARLEHTDTYASPHLAVIGAAEDDDDHAQAKALLSKASPSLIGALDFLLETYAEEMPADLSAAIHKYLDEADTPSKARKWLSGEGYGLAHHVARQHLTSFGGSLRGFKKFLKGLGHVIEAPFKFAGKLLTGGSHVAGQVASNLAPVADVAAKVAPMAAMAMA